MNEILKHYKRTNNLNKGMYYTAENFIYKDPDSLNFGISA